VKIKGKPLQTETEDSFDEWYYIPSDSETVEEYRQQMRINPLYLTASHQHTNNPHSLNTANISIQAGREFEKFDGGALSGQAHPISQDIAQ
jgi:hypothetical protein